MTATEAVKLHPHHLVRWWDKNSHHLSSVKRP